MLGLAEEKGSLDSAFEKKTMALERLRKEINAFRDKVSPMR